MADFSSGSSVMATSVISIRPATEAAFSRGSASHLGRIDDAHGLQIPILFAGAVEAVVHIVLAQNLLHNDGTFETGIGDDLTNGLLKAATHDGNTNGLVAVQGQGPQRT